VGVLFRGVFDLRGGKKEGAKGIEMYSAEKS